MKSIPFFILGCALITGCQNTNSMDQVVSQTFVHKYGFETSEKDWQEREQDGQIVSMLKNGVKVTKTYENGLLHGPTTYTFPHNKTIEKLQVYNEGNLLKNQVNDPSGMPIREDLYEYDNRVITTLWDLNGVPLSIEEYKNNVLVEGKYYTADHSLESSIAEGNGERIKRDRSGQLISKEEFVNGELTARVNFHPNGNIHTISRYKGYQLHGTQEKYTASGKPLMQLDWNDGILDGTKTIYRNGKKIAEIPYVKGKKHGIEYHYDDLGTLTAEIEWKNDKKHGSTKLFSDEDTEEEWFFKGQSVSLDKYRILDNRERIVEDFREAAVR